MADNIQVNEPVTLGKIVATQDVGGVQHEKVIIEFDDGAGGVTKVSAANPLPVTYSGGGGGAVTIVDGGDIAEGSTTDAAIVTDANGTVSGKLRGVVKLLSSWIGTLGQKTMANSASVTIASDHSAIPVSGPLTDTQLRATPVLVSGTVSTGGLTDAQLRTTPVPVSGTVTVDTSALLTTADFDTKTGSLTETAPATDTASSGLNGRLQRIAQRITSLIALLPAALGAGGGLKIDGSGTALPVTGTLFGGAVTVADGADIALGALADAIVAAGATGSVSAKLRRATQGLEDLKSLIVLASGTNLIGITQSKDLPDASATYALSNVTSTAYEASHVIKASAGYLFMITGYNSKTSSQFIMISNTTSVPADAQTPIIVFIVPASSNFSFDLGKYGRYFSTGICIFNSSTSPTKTIGSADCFFDCQFI